jgi:site-specific recombinase XerD
MKDEGHVIPRVKTHDKLPILLSDQQVTALIQYKTRKRIERRIHMMVMVVLDTGVWVDEVLTSERRSQRQRWKQRAVPFSLALRRALFRFMKMEPHPLREFLLTREAAYHRQLKLIGAKFELST